MSNLLHSQLVTARNEVAERSCFYVSVILFTGAGLCQGDPRTETPHPGQRPPETTLDPPGQRPPPGQRTPLDRDPLWTETSPYGNEWVRILLECILMLSAFLFCSGQWVDTRKL